MTSIFISGLLLSVTVSFLWQELFCVARHIVKVIKLSLKRAYSHRRKFIHSHCFGKKIEFWMVIIYWFWYTYNNTWEVDYAFSKHPYLALLQIRLTLFLHSWLLFLILIFIFSSQLDSSKTLQYGHVNFLLVYLLPLFICFIIPMILYV